MANRYWVGGTATWDGTAGTKWSTTSGGAGGAAVPTSADDVFFNAASGAVTCTVSGSRVCLSLNCTGFTGTLTGTSTPQITISGNMTLVAGMTFNGTSGPVLVFNSTTSRTITTGGKVLRSVTFSGTGGSWALQDNFDNTTSLATTTLTNGTLNLNNFTLTTARFFTSNSNTRTLAFGTTGSIALSGSPIASLTAWDGTNITNLTVTGTPDVTAQVSAGFNVTISFLHGSVSGSTEARAINFTTVGTCNNIDFAITGGFKNINLSSCGSGGSLTNTTRVIYGNLTLSSTQPLDSGNSTTTFAGTSGTQLITSNGKTLDFPVTFSGVGGTFQLQDAMTFTTNPRTLTFSAGTLDLNNFTLTASIFTSTTGTRTLAFGTGSIAIVPNLGSSTTVFALNGAGLTFTGTANASLNITTTNDTATIDAGTPTALINITNLVANSGTTVNMTSGAYNSVDFTNFIRTLVGLSFYGPTLTLNGSMTLGAGTYSFLRSTGTTALTSAGLTFPSQINLNTAGGGLTFQDAFSCTSNIGFNAGTLDGNGFNVTLAYFSSSYNGSAARTLTLGGGLWTMTGTSGWNISSATSMTFSAGASDILLSSNSTSARTFSSPSLVSFTYNKLTIGGDTATSTTTIDGNSTFSELASTKTVAHSVLFTAGNTTTVADFTITGTVGNIVTIGSSTAATHTLVKTGGGTVTVDYASISYSNATPGATWYATNSIDGGNNSGWNFGNTSSSFLVMF